MVMFIFARKRKIFIVNKIIIMWTYARNLVIQKLIAKLINELKRFRPEFRLLYISRILFRVRDSKGGGEGISVLKYTTPPTKNQPLYEKKEKKNVDTPCFL